MRGLDELERADQVFSALSHPQRRHILQVVLFRGGHMTAGDIADRFACTWPTTSRHLKGLVDAGLLVAERRGRTRVYHLDRARLTETVGGWLKYFA